jgi:hypothetical protein
VSRPPGIVAPDEPVQAKLDAPREFDARGVRLIVRARYDITARVLRKEIYRADDGADIAPVDLGVGWGPLSDTRVIDELDFSQMGRFFYWKPRHQPFAVPLDVLNSHVAQMHIIPATSALEAQIKRLRPGQIATISGYLVDVRRADGFVWNTSLTRTDTGNGACEIVWVESLAVR